MKFFMATILFTALSATSLASAQSLRASKALDNTASSPVDVPVISAHARRLDELAEDEEYYEEFPEEDEPLEDEEDFEFDEDEDFEEEFDEGEEDEEGNKVFKTRAFANNSYYYYNNKFCRTYHGGKGKEGHDYHKTHSYNCQATCNKYSWCKAYESGPHGHCELWTYRPQKVAHQHGYKCALKY